MTKKVKKPPITIPLLYRDSALLIVDKPAGMLTHPNQYDRKTPSLVNSLSGRMHARVFPAHRLDRETSGAIAFCLDKASAREMGELFSSGAPDPGTGGMQGGTPPLSVRKQYLALCAGHMADEAEVTVPVRQGGNGEKQPAVSRISGMLNFSVRGMDLCLLSVELFTGRTHQARIHCEVLGKPIIGDSQHGWKPVNREFASIPQVAELYGQSEAGMPRMYLRSWKLSLNHPSKAERIEICSGLPRSWRAVLNLSGSLPAELEEPAGVRLRRFS